MALMTPAPGPRTFPFSRAELASALSLMDADEHDRQWVERCIEMAKPPEIRLASEQLKGSDGVQIPDALAMSAIFCLAPSVVVALERRGVDPVFVHQTMGDFGRQLRRHRRLTGLPGLLNWRWFRRHLTGDLIEIGRLQFEVVRPEGELRSLVGAAALNIHIPGDSGPLDPDLVDHSLMGAARVFRRAWPELRLTHAICESWLLDPFLGERIPDSNIAAFARRFELYAPSVDEPTDPLYFLWGHRDVTRMPSQGLSALEREVVDRIGAGGTWQAGRGLLTLPSAQG